MTFKRTNLDPLCLFGAGGHGRVVASQLIAKFGITPVFGDATNAHGQDTREILFTRLSEIQGFHVCITIGSNNIRRKLFTEAEYLGLPMPAILISSNIYCAYVGAATQVLAGAVVNTGAHIGNGVIINSNAVVEHDSRVGDFCHIAPGAVLGGGVTLERGVFVGTNATLLPGVSVCHNVTIGAGAVVTKSIEFPGTYIGTPARQIV